MRLIYRFSGATDSSGYIKATVQIPGTFTTINKSDPTFSGRSILEVRVFFASPAAGDAITSMTVKDTDGLVPTGSRPAFPNYPILASWADSGVSAGNQGLYLDPKMHTSITPSINKNTIFSGGYLVGEFQKATAVVDTLYISIIWDDGT